MHAGGAPPAAASSTTSILDQLQAAVLPVMPASATASTNNAAGLQSQLDYLQTLALTSLLVDANNNAAQVAPAPAPSADVSLLAQLLLQSQQQQS